jgi:uncharacterized membrane protein
VHRKLSAVAQRELFSPERLLAFSDGVFAVAITLLVLDIRLPADGASGDAALLTELLATGPKLVVFCFSFIIVGQGWLSHHRKFSYVRKVDGAVLWFNLVYLMGICVIPFATSVLSEHGGRVGFMLYVGVLAVETLISTALAMYALRPPFLEENRLRTAARHDMVFSPLVTTTIFLASAGLAYANLLSLAHWTLFLIFPVLWFFGSRSRRGL